MVNLRKFLESPFKTLKASKPKLFKFYNDHLSRLKRAITNGEPFSSLLSATETAVTNLKISLGDQSSSSALGESKTMTVDNVIKWFKSIIALREANILIHFPLNSDIYKEFFPHGMTEYSKINKTTAENLMMQIIKALTNHKTELGQPLLDEFISIQTAYDKARDEQLQQKEETVTQRESWETNLGIIEEQAFQNLLAIAKVHSGNPKKITLFFDESIVKLHHYNAQGDEILPYILKITAKSTKAALISFSVDDKLYLYNTSDVALFYYGATTADTPTPPTAIELPAGESIEITAASIGAPLNKYLLFTNMDASEEGEVEITLLEE